MNFIRLILLSAATLPALSCQSAQPQAATEPLVTEEARLADVIFALREDVRALKREVKELKKQLAAEGALGQEELVKLLRKEFERELDIWFQK